jgi:hypothetical protein
MAKILVTSHDKSGSLSSPMPHVVASLADHKYTSIICKYACKCFQRKGFLVASFVPFLYGSAQAQAILPTTSGSTQFDKGTLNSPRTDMISHLQRHQPNDQSRLQCSLVEGIMLDLSMHWVPNLSRDSEGFRHCHNGNMSEVAGRTSASSHRNNMMNHRGWSKPSQLFIGEQPQEWHLNKKTTFKEVIQMV